MKNKIIDLIDFEKVNILLEGFNKTTGFVTAILDLEGNVLSKSGWRQICTEFHRVHPETSKMCTISDTELAGKLADSEKYHFYKCLNGLIDVAVPIVIKGEHIANLFSGQFFFEEPDSDFFKKQAARYGFDENIYLKYLGKVPVIAQEKVKIAMEFLLNMTELIVEMTLQRVEQIELNDALQASEMRFSELLENINLIAFLLNLDGKVTYCNPHLIKLAGYSKHELMGSDWFEKMIPDSNPETKQIFLNGLKNNNIAEHFENPIITKNGELRHIYWSNTILRNSSGQIIGTASIGEDITERKLAEDELRNSEIRFRQLFEINPQPMWVYDVETLHFLAVNEIAVKKYGYSKEEFLSMTLKEIRPQEDVQALLANVAESDKNLQESGIWRHKHKDGTLIFVEIYSHNLMFENKEARLVLANDITDCKQAEEEIIKSNKELLTLNRVISASTGIKNIKEIMDDVLNEAINITGLEGGTICLVEPDDTLKLISHKETSEATILDLTKNRIKIGDCLCGNCALDNCPLILYNREEVLKYATREVLRGEDIRFHAAFPFTSKGKCVGVLCVFTRTDKKPENRSLKLLETLTAQVALVIENVKLFDANQQYTTELEERVRERTDELEKKTGELVENQTALINLVEDINEKSIELEKTARLLETKNKELETFTYSVSHDLKAPLRGIDGYSRLLEELYSDKLNSEGHKFIKTIREGTKQMNQLIEDLLAYSRLERSVVRVSSLKIKQLIDTVLILLKNDIKTNKISIAVNVPECEVLADYEGLSIALRNIVENAIKFICQNESPKINIVLKENVYSWVLSVEDNGIGFDMKFHNRIFEIFQRLNLPEQYKGTGIGLAMVSKSMERMGGKVWAESTPGFGSVFYLEFPKI